MESRIASHFIEIMFMNEIAMITFEINEKVKGSKFLASLGSLSRTSQDPLGKDCFIAY